MMAHVDAREGKWRGNWSMDWVASTLHTTSKHGVSSITTADAHTSAAISRLNWRPRRFKRTRPFRRKTKSGFCACAITFQLASIYHARAFTLLTTELLDNSYVQGKYRLQWSIKTPVLWDVTPCRRIDRAWKIVHEWNKEGRTLKGKNEDGKLKVHLILFLCTPWRYTGGGGVAPLIPNVCYRWRWNVKFIPGEIAYDVFWIGDSVTPRAGLDVSESTKPPCYCRESNHNTSVVLYIS